MGEPRKKTKGGFGEARDRKGFSVPVMGDDLPESPSLQPSKTPFCPFITTQVRAEVSDGRHYFTMPGKLDIRATNFSSTRNGSIEWHSNHSKSWSELFDIANTSFTRNHSVCSWVTSVDNPRCELLVSPETFAPDRLCQCRDFYGGSGVDCIKCPGPSMKDPLNHTRRCCTCENGKARATIDNDTAARLTLFVSVSVCSWLRESCSSCL